ncbi:MAG: DUF484 family protein [Marinobacterium sp.]|nr:DUF484 family protein [Marinobacterium sp.]
MSASDLERENRELKRTLRLMVNKAESDEAILTGFFALELELLRCKRLQQLLETVLHTMQEHFKICSVDMLLLDPEHSARQLLTEENLQQHGHHLRFLDHPKLLKKLFPRRSPLLGTIQELPQLRSCFSHIEPRGSSAALPLMHGDYLIGALHLHSHDAERYSNKYRYDYVAHLASVIAICMENCISHENLHRLSMVDMLTKVMNRRSFDQDILREISRSSREETALSCLFLDMDHFKKVNDSFGHLSGDQVLRTIGHLLRSAVRKTDLVARYGGEEFAILLPGCEKPQACELAERLRGQIQALIFRSESGHPFRLSASIGVSTCHPAELPDWSQASIANELIHAADTAVYQAKHNGRNQVYAVPFPGTPLYDQLAHA